MPGIFITNEYPKFNCEWVELKVGTSRTPFTKAFKKDEIIKLPIAHAEGRFYTEDIDLLKDQDQIVLQFEGRTLTVPWKQLQAYVTSPDWYVQ